MGTVINRTSEILEQLTRENKVHIMNSANDRAEADRINKEMEKVRRDYLIKSSRSQIDAAKAILTA